MLDDPNAFFAGRRPGVSSRLRPAAGPKTSWYPEPNVVLDLPVLLDLVEIAEDGSLPVWWVAAKVDCRDGVLVVTQLGLGSDQGLDLLRLQREFRWLTPIDIVTRIVPRLLRDGVNPFDYDFPSTGYPEVSTFGKTQGRRLSDEFLEDIAREYLLLGRGHLSKMATTHHVSERTVASWIQKARARGIL
ncbi:MAG: hypothetical protein WBZ04_10920, partial [Candidatus Nanopelagicales bacterium]